MSDPADGIGRISEASIDGARALPLDTRFVLGERLTEEQRGFLWLNGYLLFGEVASPSEIAEILSEVDRVHSALDASGRDQVNGIPILVGEGPSGRMIQRLPFTSTLSPSVRAFVRDARFDPIRALIGRDTRVGDEEKDGVVFNQYANVDGSLRPGLGWHTDGLRSIAYGRLPGPMLNVGLHFDRIAAADGGLRLVPGTHHQGLWSMCFHKPYFVSHEPDPAEIAIETLPGDLTVHDGRLWHRVQASPRTGAESLRRSMYVPYLVGPYEPKSESSPMPLYHRVFRWALSQRAWFNRGRIRLG
jgi:phytanoyl-CoA hydroxylase